MKKLVQIFIFACVVCLNVQIGFSAEKVWSDDNFDLSSIHRIYFDDMNYGQIADSPQPAEIMNMFYAQGAQAKLLILQQTDVDRLLLRDFKVEIKNLDAKTAKKVIKEHLNAYVDVYIVPTIVHNNRVVIFYDVYSAQTGKMVFSYQTIAGAKDEDNLETYEALTKNFYKALDKEAHKQLKKKK